MKIEDHITLNMPKVSIGIPTYNRASFLKRSIESAIFQDYPNIEILVSDNASTDDTPVVCQGYGDRIKYFRQPLNLGPVTNFTKVLEMASGEFFMWLGDDDWIDQSYVRYCVEGLMSDPFLSLVSGVPQYYRKGAPVFTGKRFNLLYEFWWLRVAVYYAKVEDNGMFYGVMRKSQIRRIKMSNTMGGDWHLIAGLASMGKIKILPGVRVHRELGGATVSYYQIARSLRLSNIYALFPMTSVALTAWADIATKGTAYDSRTVIGRLMLGSIVFCLILLKRFLGYWKLVAKFMVNKISVHSFHK